MLPGRRDVMNPQSSYAQDEGTPLLGEHKNHHYHIDITESIYAAALYAPSVSRIKTGRGVNGATCIVWAMIILNMILQLGLLRVMDLYRNRDSETMRVFAYPGDEPKFAKKMYQSFLTPREVEVLREVEKGTPPCILNNGTYSCSPAITHFALDWESLDVNSDGVWTISEAQGKMKEGASEGEDEGEDEEEDDGLGKRRTVIFNTIIGGLKQRVEWLAKLNKTNNGTTLYLPQDVVATRAIPKPFFDYWVGDAMLCTRFESLGCESVVASGLFDAALNHGRFAAAHKGIMDYSSALRYCRMMLVAQGGCDQSLPVSLRSSVSGRSHQCGEVSASAAGDVTNPYDSAEVLQVTELSFAHLDEQKEALHPTFLFFQILIMFLFYASFVAEIREIIKKIDFLISFPGTKGPEDRGGEDLGEDEEEGRYIIERMHPSHRASICGLVVLRLVIAFVVIRYGTWFLLAETGYMELVLNAVALSFITGIDEMIYSTFMESKTQAEVGFSDAQRIKYAGYIPRDGGIVAGVFRKDVWGLVFVPIISVSVVLYWEYYLRQPDVEALTCSCLQEGRHCAEAMVNQEAWWKEYWTRTLPSAIHHINAMRLKGV